MLTHLSSFQAAWISFSLSAKPIASVLKARPAKDRLLAGPRGGNSQGTGQAGKSPTREKHADRWTGCYIRGGRCQRNASGRAVSEAALTKTDGCQSGSWTSGWPSNRAACRHRLSRMPLDMFTFQAGAWFLCALPKQSGAGVGPSMCFCRLGWALLIRDLVACVGAHRHPSS